jgi:enoyl-CoA hydratase
MGLANRVVPAGTAREAAEALALEIAGFPQTCLRGDRMSLITSQGLPVQEALANELTYGVKALDEALEGAARFVSGEGRHGVF